MSWILRVLWFVCVFLLPQTALKVSLLQPTQSNAPKQVCTSVTNPSPDESRGNSISLLIKTPVMPIAEQQTTTNLLA